MIPENAVSANSIRGKITGDITRAIFIALAIACFNFLVVATYAQMDTDDFCYAANSFQYGILGATTRLYYAFHARYSQLILSGILYHILGSHAPAASAVLLIAGLICASWFAFGWRGVWFAICYLLALHDYIWQGVYWMAAGITYLAPIVLLMVLYGLLQRKSHWALLFTLAFFISGFNESIGPVVILAALVFRKRSVAFGALLGLVVILLAPGNAIRAASAPETTLANAIALSIEVWFSRWADLALHVPAALLGSFVVGLQMPGKVSWRLIMICLFAFAIGTIPGIYELCMVYVRTLIMPIGAMLLLCFHMGQIVSAKYQLHPTRQLKQTTAILMCLASFNISLGVLPQWNTNTFSILVGTYNTENLNSRQLADCRATLSHFIAPAPQ